MQNRILLVEDDEELRQLRTQTHLPVVLLTARGDEIDRIVGFEVGDDPPRIEIIRGLGYSYRGAM